MIGLITPLDPLHGDGYQFWSGIGLGWLGWSVYMRKHNCHRKWCPFLSWHEGEDGHPVCRLHHKDHHGPLSRLFHRLGWRHGNSGAGEWA